MAKIHTLMDIGKRSMMNSQTALATVAHNMANKSTEGYSRQRVDQVANAPVTEGGLQIGTGARAAAVSRTNNPWLERQLEREGAEFKNLETRADAMSKIEQIFNEQETKSINAYISDFFNSFRELANSPESTTARTVVKESAEHMVDEFKSVHKKIEGIQRSLDNQLESNVVELNAEIKEIAQLNEKIQSIEITGGTANDERDRRELLLKKVAEKADITYGEDKKSGMISMTIGKNAVVVSGSSYTTLATVDGPDKKKQILYELSPGGTAVDISGQIKKGSMGAAVDIRDNLTESLKSDLNKLAYTIANEVNSAHVEGFDRLGNPGVEFFDISVDENKAITSLKVSENISDDVTRIAAAARSGAPGDNTVANVLHNIQFQPLMTNGGNIDDFYNSRVGEVGIIAQKAMKGFESQKHTVTQLSNLRESISGVSLDEEAARMIEFQKAYEASARLIKVADEMFETVLNLKRL